MLVTINIMVTGQKSPPLLKPKKPGLGKARSSGQWQGKTLLGNNKNQ